MILQISRSEALITIPPRKVVTALEQTLSKCEECGPKGAKLDHACDKCCLINQALKRYAQSNIPIRYWGLSMKDFKGDGVLIEKYNEITTDLHTAYNDGICLCFAGKHGVGKTYLCTNILKRAVEKGYQCLYTTLSDVVSNAVSGPIDQKFKTRKELIMVDFLVLDEFDPRYMPTDASSDLFGRQMEEVFRKRTENQLPTFMCTNSPNVIDSFQGPIKQSIESLMNFTTTITVVGKDFREVYSG